LLSAPGRLGERHTAGTMPRQSGIPGEQLAEAAGLSVPRVYQIRDGRR